ncbi:HNH endonuclease family protein [Mucilaginibacter glaciei]|uniref:HNH endonuclease n=1 Tax=Mucilaginibacter glaciei TaxID=2772109 RepID=A0A926NR41_9SPHI|nr:HNH endonuclease [Mucilaginibacter glaciei]MBD1393828.1 HNH endonuclease [Mucilaginibacter glaciei]
MIHVNRAAKPPILSKKEAVWVAAINGALLKPRTPTVKLELDKAINKYQHNKIKDALVLMFHGKCAYCESYIINVDYGDIEHFKPKGKFPLEAVVWENLLLACAKCNGAGQKGDEWPLLADGGLLINPCTENPADFFEFEFDVLTDIALVNPKNVRGETSEKIFGLNKPTLVKDRNIAVKRLVALASYYHTDARAKAYLDEAALDKSEYSAFAKMIINTFVI